MGFGLGFLGGFAHDATETASSGSEQQLRKLELLRDLENDPIRRALMMQQLNTGSKQILKNPDDTYSIIDLANPTATAIHVGQARNYKDELTALKKGGQIPTALGSAVDAALQTGDPQMQRDVYESAIKLIGSPAFEKANLTTAEKAEALTQYLQSGTLPPLARKAVQQALAGNNPAMIESVYTKVIPPVFGGGAYGMRVLNQTSVDPNTGLPVTNPFVMPARGGAAMPVLGGGGGGGMPSGLGGEGGTGLAPPPFGGGGGAPLSSVKIGASESKLIGQVQQLLPQLESLKADIQAIGPERWNLARAKYPLIKYAGVSVTGDDAEKTIQKAIQVESAAQAALAAASGTRAYGFIQHSKGHLPSGGSDYNYNINAIDNLLSPDGPYKPILKLYGINAMSAGGSAEPELPPASLIPLNTKRTFSNGKTYQNVGGSISEVTP